MRKLKQEPKGDGEGASKRAEHGIHTTQGGVEKKPMRK
jgi:hypothetical protein